MSHKTDSSPEIYHLANQLQRINYLGNVQTIQIEFEYIAEDKKTELVTLFNDSTGLGQFKSEMIILEQISGRDMLEIINTLHNISTICGDLSLAICEYFFVFHLMNSYTNLLLSSTKNKLSTYTKKTFNILLSTRCDIYLIWTLYCSRIK